MKYTKEQIREENDRVRKGLLNSDSSSVFMTPGVAHADNRDEILEAVRNFDDFNSGNDPYKEHDTAIFKIKDKKYMFKIDYYDLNQEFGVDPLEEDCFRVLTIMLASEY